MSLQQKIVDQLQAKFSGANITVKVEGNHAILQIIGDQFEGCAPVKRQQLVYGCINDLIQSGELHAVSIHTKTPLEIANP